MDRLLLVTTGGTIDKMYFDQASEYRVGEPQGARILKAMRVEFQFEVRSLMRKDSLEITDADRQVIHTTVANTDLEHVLITHGTDTMVDTALALRDIEGKTIVLTGSLNPAQFKDSDAVFNVGCAIGALQSLPHGVWITMNGRVWDPTHVRKNRDRNRFEAA